MNLTSAGKHESKEFQISLRVYIDKNGTPWFDATTICQTLGYERKPAAMMEKLDNDEKALLGRENFDCTDSVGSGGAQNKWFVNESGLYSLIFYSEKKEAKRFRKWVTSEVLPAIRKTGSYSLTKKQLLQEQVIAQYILPEFRPWSKLFPDYYHDAVCKMMDWGPYYPGRPMPDGMKWFNSRYIYKELPDGVYDEIKKKNPWIADKGRREHKNHQICTEIAQNHVEKQIDAIVWLIRGALYDKEKFRSAFKANFKKDRYGKILEHSPVKLILDKQICFEFMDFVE